MRKIIANITAVLIAISAFSFVVFAESSIEYLKRLEAVRTGTDQFLEYAEATEDDADRDRKYETEFANYLKTQLPPVISVEHNSVKVDCDLSWVAGVVERYDEAIADLDKRRDAVEEVNERLQSAIIKLNELNISDKRNTTKDQEKQQLQEILNQPEFGKPKEKEESALSKWLKELREWLSGKFPEPNINPSTVEGMSGFAKVLQYAFAAIFIAIIGFVLYKFLPKWLTYLEKRKTAERGERIILGERISAEESGTDVFADAEALAGKGEFRAAVRKGYIAFLCELGDARLIRLATHKTNRDYLRDAKKHDRIFNGTNQITGAFEQHWYGLSEVTEADWDEFRKKFRETVATARSSA